MPTDTHEHMNYPIKLKRYSSVSLKNLVNITASLKTGRLVISIHVAHSIYIANYIARWRRMEPSGNKKSL